MKDNNRGTKKKKKKKKENHEIWELREVLHPPSAFCSKGRVIVVIVCRLGM
jgi:hypothetical protein